MRASEERRDDITRKNAQDEIQGYKNKNERKKNNETAKRINLILLSGYVAFKHSHFISEKEL